MKKKSLRFYLNDPHLLKDKPKQAVTSCYSLNTVNILVVTILPK